VLPAYLGGAQAGAGSLLLHRKKLWQGGRGKGSGDFVHAYYRSRRVPVFAPYGATPWLCGKGYAEAFGKGERRSSMGLEYGWWFTKRYISIAAPLLLPEASHWHWDQIAREFLSLLVAEGRIQGGGRG
jgi:hypothetical protein